MLETSKFRSSDIFRFFGAMHDQYGRNIVDQM